MKNKRNDTIGKCKKEIVLQVESSLYMQKKKKKKRNLALIIKLKNTIKTEIFVITLVDIETLLIMFVTYDTTHQKKFLWYFIMVLNMTINL